MPQVIRLTDQLGPRPRIRSDDPERKVVDPDAKIFEDDAED
jgi:hypothetical protein